MLCSLVLVVGELIQQKQKVHRVIILIGSAVIDLDKVGINTFSLTEQYRSKSVEKVRVLLRG
jgi:hypothetical protein